MDFSTLNPQQLQAVQTVDGPLLVLAGAGSGKTRVLTYRIANLIYNHNVPAYSILALTFTNKAAREMRERIETLVGLTMTELWMSTFHSCCVRILSVEIERIGYEKSFVVYDDADQLSLYAQIIKEYGLDDKKFPKRLLRSCISHAKNHSFDVEKYLIDMGYDTEYVSVYRAYQNRMKKCNALDFDDLILLSVKLFKECPDVLEKYRKKFRYLLIDEYQDTNMAQFELIRLLGAQHKNVCVVGDDDQSIYGWRGADIKNILEFEKHFSGAKVIRLEQNYRSTSVILDAANSVIRKNIGRKSKKLWTNREGGSGIRLFEASDDRLESDYIARSITKNVNAGRRYDEHAILYRTNAQSRLIETALTSYGIPYKVYGGVRFYERAEIKDILAYLRLIYNPTDDMAFLRVVNTPKRGLGSAAINELSECANGEPLFITAISEPDISARVKTKLTRFTDEITELITIRDTMPLSEFAELLIERIDYINFLMEDKKENSATKIENIHELIGAISEYEQGAAQGTDTLGAFLENVSLVSDIDHLEHSDGQVALMTLHSAKGLEFPVVFISGMEETIFPSLRSIQEPEGLEEERRLCYVGLTRAMDELHLVYARERNLYGRWNANKPSRFLSDIPATLFDDFTKAKPMSKPARAPASTPTHGGFGPKPVHKEPVQSAQSFKTNQRVRHLTFGKGIITRIEGEGGSQIITIDFGHAVKRFSIAYAPIESDK